MNGKVYAGFLRFCKEDKIEYVLLRYPHILPREIHDLDMLISSPHDYRSIFQYLHETGYICLEKEPKRSFWAKKVGKELAVIDLYREISWLGWTLLDKKEIMRRKKKLKNELVVCSDEDEILVYLAQALFKNNGLNAYKMSVLKKLFEKDLDWNYLSRQMKHGGWRKQGKKLLLRLKKSDAQYIQRTKFEFLKTILSAASKKNSMIRFSALLSRVVSHLLSRIRFPKKITTICLLGPDGSGKSTLSKNICREYKTFFQKFEPGADIVYFGWKPFLPTTKLISSFFKNKEYNIIREMNDKQNKKKKLKQVLLQPLLFLYLFIEYLARYCWLIGSYRSQKKIIIIDRYFYDLYAHYQCAEKDFFFGLLLTLFPRPDYTFLLDVPIETLYKRKQEMSKEKLQEHRQKYRQLVAMLSLAILDTTKNIEACKEEIMTKTWKKISRRIK